MGTRLRKTRHTVFKTLKMTARLFCPAHTIAGTENVRKGSSAIFVCNHMGSYAPVVMQLFFPFSFRPWVTYQVVTRKLCRQYLEQDFVKKELKWRRPFSRWLAALIEPFCIRVLKSAEAIPVYKGKREIRETFERSVAALEEGNNIAIYLEDAQPNDTKRPGYFQSGFIHLAKLYRRDTDRELLFYPVFVDKEKRNIAVGRPIGLASKNDFSTERKRIGSYLQNAAEETALSK